MSGWRRSNICAKPLMATFNLPPDFKEFLQLLHDKKVEYLVVGGYAVAFHGFPRPTGDIDIWIAVSPGNAALMSRF